MTDQRLAEYAGWCVLAYAIAVILTVTANILFWGAELPSSSALVILVCGAVASLGISLSADHERTWIVVAVTYLIIAVLSSVALARGSLPLRPYGDGNSMNDLVAAGVAYPRWLIPTSVLGWFHRGFWSAPPIAQRLPVSARGVPFMNALMCIVFMAGGALWISARYRDKALTLLPLLTPVCLLFVTGYTEVYPLLAAPVIGLLAFMSETPPQARSPLSVGILCGLLPITYIGLLPISVVLLLTSVLVNTRTFPKTALVAFSTLVLGVVACRSDGVNGFLTSLFGEMNFGDTHTMFPRYVGHAASATAVWFGGNYVWNSGHLADLAYMYSWGGGIAVPLLLVIAAVACVRRHSLRDLFDSRPFELGALFLLYVYYFFLMMPKMGPRADVDLFFTTFLITAFIAGAVLDATGVRRRTKAVIISAMLGNAAAAAAYLCLGIIPDRH